ncbi:MAG: hypothetical protein RR619_11210 [Raoultibacter sp.]
MKYFDQARRSAMLLLCILTIVACFLIDYAVSLAVASIVREQGAIAL